MSFPERIDPELNWNELCAIWRMHVRIPPSSIAATGGYLSVVTGERKEEEEEVEEEEEEKEEEEGYPMRPLPARSLRHTKYAALPNCLQIWCQLLYVWERTRCMRLAMNWDVYEHLTGSAGVHSSQSLAPVTLA